MINAVLRMLLRCSHRHITRPITPAGDSRVAQGGPYVVCLDCGTQFPYDWENMRLGRPIRQPRKTDAHAVRIGEN